MECSDGEDIPLDVVGTSMVYPSVFGLETETGHLGDDEGGFGGRSGGVEVVSSPSAYWTRC